MSIKLNLSGNAYFTPALGYPVRLWLGGDTYLEGFTPKWIASITASAAAERGTCNLHMAIYSAPTTVGGSDGALVSETSLAAISTTAQSLTLTMPSTSTAAAHCYVFRLWVDGISGTNGVSIKSVTVA